MAEERTIKGNRFEASYSMNRRYADIVDRKQKGILKMVTWDEMEALRERLKGIARDYRNTPGQMTPFNVSYPRTHSKIAGLNYEDAVELGDLAELLTTILVNLS